MQFGGAVRKVSLDFGAGCPNRDKCTPSGGCVFCDPASFSPSRRQHRRSVEAQLDDAIAKLSPDSAKIVAYFQPGTNTYAPVEELRRHFLTAIHHPRVAGLAIGTRPDCVGNEVLDLLAELAEKTWLILELGLQSIHDRTLEAIHRGHDYAAFLDAVARAQARGLNVGAHVILGLPGETDREIVATAKELARLRVHSVKIHNLYAAKNTPLAELVASGEVRLPQRNQYVAWVADFLEHLWPQTVIDRLTASAPPEYLVGPAWCLDKPAILKAIDAELLRRDTWQGKKFEDSAS